MMGTDRMEASFYSTVVAVDFDFVVVTADTVASVVCLKNGKIIFSTKTKLPLQSYVLFPKSPENIDDVDDVMPFISLLNDEKKSLPVPAINPPPP